MNSVLFRPLWLHDLTLSNRIVLSRMTRPFISNPDLVERFKNNWPLAEPAPMSDWYSPVGAKGYTDFPAHEGFAAAIK